MKNNQLVRMINTSMMATMSFGLKIISRNFFMYTIIVNSGQSVIAFWPIPIFIAGYFYGPFYGLAAGFITDTIFILFDPSAQFYNLMTISAMIWGLFGYFSRIVAQHFNTKKMKYTLIAILITICSFTQTFINSIQTYFETRSWLTVYQRLAGRIVGLGLTLPILIIVSIILIDRLQKIILNE